MMPCNPSIGGLAKSHLVVELDALGGEMGVNADLCGLQFKTLNASRGPAVRATRVQCDKRQYARRMQQVIASTANLSVIEDEVTAITIDQDVVCGVTCAAHGAVSALTVILTTGTALRGRLSEAMFKRVFFAGLLLSRLGAAIRVRGGFWWCSLLIAAASAYIVTIDAPRTLTAGEPLVVNGTSTLPAGWIFAA